MQFVCVDAAFLVWACRTSDPAGEASPVGHVYTDAAGGWRWRSDKVRTGFSYPDPASAGRELVAAVSAVC